MRDRHRRVGKRTVLNSSKHKRIISKYTVPSVVPTRHELARAQSPAPRCWGGGRAGALIRMKRKSKEKLRVPQLCHLVAKYVSPAAQQVSTPHAPQDAEVYPAARMGFQEAPGAHLAPGGWGEARGGCSEPSRTIGLSSFRSRVAPGGEAQGPCNGGQGYGGPRATWGRMTLPWDLGLGQFLFPQISAWLPRRKCSFSPELPGRVLSDSVRTELVCPGNTR